MKVLTPDDATTASQAMVPIAEVCGISSIQFDSIGITIDSLLKFIQFQIGIPYEREFACVCVWVREREREREREGKVMVININGLR